MSVEEDRVRQVIADWIDATATGDLDRVLTLMTDDVEFVTPSRPPFGKKEFAGQSGSMNLESFAGAADIREVIIAGDYAIVRNDLSIEMALKGEAPLRLKGPILSVFKKGDDGNWRLWRDANFVAPTGAKD